MTADLENVVLHTGGDGYWSEVAKPVTVTSIGLGYIDDEEGFGELRVYFDTDTWNTEEDGLIYTDDNFESELRDALNKAGLAGSDVSYSEQGMQGDDYVSLDVGKKFINSWKKAGNPV